MNNCSELVEFFRRNFPERVQAAEAKPRRGILLGLLNQANQRNPK
jgi:hypothetical protein